MKNSEILKQLEEIKSQLKQDQPADTRSNNATIEKLKNDIAETESYINITIDEKIKTIGEASELYQEADTIQNLIFLYQEVTIKKSILKLLLKN